MHFHQMLEKKFKITKKKKVKFFSKIKQFTTENKNKKKIQIFRIKKLTILLRKLPYDIIFKIFVEFRPKLFFLNKNFYEHYQNTILYKINKCQKIENSVSANFSISKIIHHINPNKLLVFDCFNVFKLKNRFSLFKILMNSKIINKLLDDNPDTIFFKYCFIIREKIINCSSINTINYFNQDFYSYVLLHLIKKKLIKFNEIPDYFFKEIEKKEKIIYYCLKYQ
jgi:hypothetical protein